ncbi:protein kinase family protein [Streptomyces sp. NPDC002619]|uniref:protein kinase family protein n=1 Tax=Streptomyces sp. NPDC002619 TaxID=3364655 RepID=UPI0036B93E05
MSVPARLTAHSDIATALALFSDHELTDLVAAGVPLDSGNGGRAVRISVEGRDVFVKRVPLTDLERLPENARSTANLFGLPSFCHYGIGAVGSPGFGAWRELAAHTMTTNWVLARHCPAFPLLHHWRVLPGPPAPPTGEPADVDGAVAYWGGTDQLRERIEALRTATASLTLFLEWIPYTLHDWLDARLRTDATGAACAFAAQGLDTLVDFLDRHGLLHLDAHFGSILTDGRQLYLSGYDLALSSRFQLARDEHDFFERHRRYDRDHTTYHLVNWLVTALYRYGPEERETFVRACADGARPEGIPQGAAELLMRHAQLAVTMGEFSRRFEKESRLTPYPYAYSGAAR